MTDGYSDSEVEVIKLQITNATKFKKQFKHTNLKPPSKLAVEITPTFWASDRRKVPLQLRVYGVHDDGSLKKGGHTWIAGGGQSREEILNKLAEMGLRAA